MGDLSLASLEDAFYAREAVEMARSGRIYTVTWNEVPAHQHPPLHLWLVARTFGVLGEGDLAARLPTVLLALGTLALTWRIGVLTLGRAAAVAATACLLATPIFVDNARRLMMEVPLTFWTTATVWVYLEARRQPRWQVALAVPLGAAILTKSVLGLMPLLAGPGCGSGSRSASASARRGSATSGGPRDRGPSRRTSSRTWSDDPRDPSVCAPSTPTR
jgi:4-amino-4-deoxy-L-arabinose transferase-like glycosyltransferase